MHGASCWWNIWGLSSHSHSRLLSLFLFCPNLHSLSSSFPSHSRHFPSFSSLSSSYLVLSSFPLLFRPIPARESEGVLWAPQRGPVPNPDRKHILTHLRPSKRISWQHLLVVYVQCKWLNECVQNIFTRTYFCYFLRIFLRNEAQART